jgi:hypothetical protein
MPDEKDNTVTVAKKDDPALKPDPKAAATNASPANVDRGTKPIDTRPSQIQGGQPRPSGSPQPPQGASHTNPIVASPTVQPSSPKGANVAPAERATDPVNADLAPYEPNLLLHDKNLDEVVYATEVANAVTSHRWRGACRKCGWQTHLPTRGAVIDAVKDHARRHVLDAVPLAEVTQNAGPHPITPAVRAAEPRPQPQQPQSKTEKPAV